MPANTSSPGTPPEPTRFYCRCGKRSSDRLSAEFCSWCYTRTDWGRAPLAPSSAPAPTTWLETAEATFPHSRPLTPEERAEFDAAAWPDLEPVEIAPALDGLRTAAREYLRCDDLGGNTPTTERALATQRARTVLRAILNAPSPAPTGAAAPTLEDSVHCQVTALDWRPPESPDDVRLTVNMPHGAYAAAQFKTGEAVVLTRVAASPAARAPARAGTTESDTPIVFRNLTPEQAVVELEANAPALKAALGALEEAKRVHPETWHLLVRAANRADYNAANALDVAELDARWGEALMEIASLRAEVSRLSAPAVSPETEREAR